MKYFVALFVLVAMGVPVAADNKIVLESYTGGKTQAAAKQLAPLLEALARRGFLGGYDVVGRAFESRASKPATAGGLPADFAKKVEEAKQAWVAGRYTDAANELGPLIDLAHANAGVFATNKDALGAVETALIVVALSYERMGDSLSAQTAWAELVRSFPDKSVPRGTWGVDAAQAFEKAKKAVFANGVGKLLVKSSTDAGVIFINERYEQLGTVTKDNLPVGDYRVFVQLPGNRLSRQHRVSVRAKETAVVTIDADLDLVVQTSPTWTGLAFTSAGDREKFEIDRAAQFASAVEATAVLVVGIDQIRGKPAIVGILVNRNRGSEIRRASVQLDPAPPAERLQALAAFLVGDLTTAPDGVDVDMVAAPVGPGPVDRGGGAWGGWKWVTGVTGVVALGAGAYLLSQDGDCKTTPPPGVTCPDVYNNAVPGYLAVGGGAVLTGLSIYLFVRAGGSAKAQTAYMIPTTGGAMAGFARRF